MARFSNFGEVCANELYAALDWLGARREHVEKSLARKHPRDRTLALHDVSSSHVEGRRRELARRGYHRDGKKGKPRIVYGLPCAPDGCPAAVEAFEGDTADARRLGARIDKIRKRFGSKHVALAGDRGIITQARIDEEPRPAQRSDRLDWIAALRATDIQAVSASGGLRISLFDARDMASIASPDFLERRLIVRRNPRSREAANAQAPAVARRDLTRSGKNRGGGRTTKKSFTRESRNRTTSRQSLRPPQNGQALRFGPRS